MSAASLPNSFLQDLLMSFEIPNLGATDDWLTTFYSEPRMMC